jgi:multiple sugar transport system substrate-binding protein
MDLSGLIKKANIDLGNFVPQSVQGIHGLTDGKTMSALPFSINAGALFYNKNLFDKFGVAYPTDGMTWDQVLALSRKLTREEDGTQYIGWDPGFPDAIESPYSNPFVDPKTNKALIDIPVYHTIFNMLKDVYDQPGYIGKGNKFAYGPDSFIKDQNLAMISEWMIKMLYPLIDASDQGAFKDWDLVTIPNFPENAGKGRHALTSMLMISNTSPHKEQAMQVLQMVSTPEAQMLQSRNARITVLNDKEIEKQFGADVPAMQGKNVASVFKLPPSTVPKPNLYDKDVQPFIRQTRNALVVDKKDVNTALRDAQAAADKKLAELQAQ